MKASTLLVDILSAIALFSWAAGAVAPRDEAGRHRQVRHGNKPHNRRFPQADLGFGDPYTPPGGYPNTASADYGESLSTTSSVSLHSSSESGSASKRSTTSCTRASSSIVSSASAVMNKTSAGQTSSGYELTQSTPTSEPVQRTATPDPDMNLTSIDPMAGTLSSFNATDTETPVPREPQGVSSVTNIQNATISSSPIVVSVSLPIESNLSLPPSPMTPPNSTLTLEATSILNVTISASPATVTVSLPIESSTSLAPSSNTPALPFPRTSSISFYFPVANSTSISGTGSGAPSHVPSVSFSFPVNSTWGAFATGTLQATEPRQPSTVPTASFPFPVNSTRPSATSNGVEVPSGIPSASPSANASQCTAKENDTSHPSGKPTHSFTFPWNSISVSMGATSHRGAQAPSASLYLSTNCATCGLFTTTKTVESSAPITPSFTFPVNTTTAGSKHSSELPMSTTPCLNATVTKTRTVSIDQNTSDVDGLTWVGAVSTSLNTTSSCETTSTIHWANTTSTVSPISTPSLNATQSLTSRLPANTASSTPMNMTTFATSTKATVSGGGLPSLSIHPGGSKLPENPNYPFGGDGPVHRGQGVDDLREGEHPSPNTAPPRLLKRWWKHLAGGHRRE